MGQAGSQTPTIPPTISPTLPARGCHRNGATSGKDQRPSPQPDVARPRTRSSRGLRGGGSDGRAVGDTPEPAPRWLLPTPAHIRVPISSHQHNPVLPSGTLTFAEAVCGEQGGHWKRQRRQLAPAPHAARSTQNRTAPSTPQHPEPYSTPKPAAAAPLPWAPQTCGAHSSSISPRQPLGLPVGTRGMPWVEKGKNPESCVPEEVRKALAWHPSLPVVLWLDRSSAGSNQPLERAPMGPELPAPHARVLVPAGLGAVPQAPIRASPTPHPLAGGLRLPGGGGRDPVTLWGGDMEQRVGRKAKQACGPQTPLLDPVYTLGIPGRIPPRGCSRPRAGGRGHAGIGHWVCWRRFPALAALRRRLEGTKRPLATAGIAPAAAES